MAVFPSAIQTAVRSICAHIDSRPETTPFFRTLARLGVVNADPSKPPICTADELHYVTVHNSDWRLALWRYKPPRKAPPRNHPLVLLSGVGTNAIGFDLSPGSSFARYMSSQGFDTWILEVRGAGLSTKGMRIMEGRKPTHAISEQIDSTIDHYKNGLREAEGNSVIDGHIADLGQSIMDVTEKGQRYVSSQFIDLQDHFSPRIEDFQTLLGLKVKYDWDFDHYLEEDVPAAMAYIRTKCKPKDDKLLAVGHSMGGILLYAMLSRSGFDGRDSGLASVITLGSSLDYTTSKSSLKFLLPLADPAQALNVPLIPLGALLAAAYPLAVRPPYILSWLNSQISAENMMHPELFEKLILNNFCNIPTKLLVQLTTAFQGGGLCDRSRSFFYKDHLHKIKVPTLALAGDQDLICPPEAVYETAKLIPRDLVTFKVFGEPGGPHYGHYNLVGGYAATDQVYPCIIEFLSLHDTA
ncbi:hypothetical protein NMG60_11002335 [Bertholletia excelsa]